MRFTPVTSTAAALGAAVLLSLAGSPASPMSAASARQPTTVKVGSSGNRQLDDICRQMGDLINSEIAAGVNEEGAGNLGEAEAWYAQASDHIRRSQALGCVMGRRAPRPGTTVAPARVNDRATASGSSGSGATGGTSSGGSTATARKKISGRAGTGPKDLKQSSCDLIADFVNDALEKSDRAALEGDPGAAQGWRTVANDLLAAGREGGCGWTAARRAPSRAAAGQATGVTGERR